MHFESSSPAVEAQRFQAQEDHCPPVITINETTVERVRFLWVHVSEDLTWTHHIDFNTLKNPDSGSSSSAEAAEAQHGLKDPLQLLQVHHREDPDWLHHRLLWQLLLDHEALQREVKAAQHITSAGRSCPSMEDLYTQRCRRKAYRIITDFSNPSLPQTVLSAAVWPTVPQPSSPNHQAQGSFIPQDIRLLFTAPPLSNN
ncbi:hypothetical protein L3Q82_001588 [Scortum barcoo]|uniref:Uncharacterized protein n=1 Tax=Scortum barcoo TaxID=214431 RepID=A0ACB8W8L7_9TELE|nr:hypothetical protein L3Q82_001588 [Scortum barcoo]